MQQLMTLTTGLALAVPLAFALPLLIWLVYSRMSAGLVIVLATFFVEVVYVEYPGLWVGIYMYPSDLAFVILAVAAVLRLLFARDFPGRSLPWLLFGVMIAVSFFFGLVQFGRTAGTDFRHYFYLWVCVLYFMSFPIDDARMKSILRLWLVFSGPLLALACFRWVAEFTGMPIADTWRPADDAAAAYRVLPSGAALFLLNTLVILIYQVTARTAKRWIWVAVPVVAAAVIVLQHRSVWISACAAFATLYIVFPGQIRLKLARPFIVAAIFLIAVGGGLVGYGKLDSLLSSVTHSAAKVTDSKGTAAGRTYGWQQLLIQVEPEEYLTGKPFGSGYERYDFPNVRWKATYDPHNFYLQTFLRTGIPGLLLFLLAYLLTLPLLLRDKVRAEMADLPPRLIFVLLVAQMAFMFPYRLPYEQGIWLGLGISMAASLRRARAEAWHSPGAASGGAQPTTAV